MAAGQTAALSMGFALAAVAKQLIGLSDDEEEAIRARVAPWQKNAPLIITSYNRETGEIEYFDASYNDQFSVFTNPAIALMRGEPGEAGGELAEPFVAEDLAFSSMVSLMRNQDENGRPIWDEGLSPAEQNKQVARYLAERFEPGTITSMRRISRAARGETSRSGKKYDLSNELSSLALGMRRDTLDRAQSDFYRNREFNGRVEKSNASIRSMFLRKGSFDAEEVRRQHASAESARQQSLTEWREFVDGSILLGEQNPYAKVVSDVGAESNIVKMMYAGQYAPYQFREADLVKMLSLPQGEERLALYLELLTLGPRPE